VAFLGINKMATKKYGIDVGASYTTITAAAGSATTKGLELTVDLAKFTASNKKQVLLALDEIKVYITRTFGS
jgi:hypothetical protein